MNERTTHLAAWRLALLGAALAIAGFSGAARGELAWDARIEGREVLTPRPGPEPRIHVPSVYGCRPNRPLVLRIPATGRRPMRFSARGLPPSVKLDADQGVLRGFAPPAVGEYEVVVEAANAEGRDQARLTLVVGGSLALTPPMGWNHWYTHYHFVTDRIIRSAADAMVSSGMADVGYRFVSIDDCWMRIDPQYVAESTDPKRRTASKGLDVAAKAGPTRDGRGRILPARDFPDMKGLTDYIHHYGLKAGIYTSPGPRTCQRFEGSYQHEAQDAETFARWGFDLLKYDWCSYGQVVGRSPTLEDLQRPYRLMGGLLRRQDRDIVLNLCQYGRGEVWKWGKAVGGHSWRIGGDLGHTLLEGGVYRIAKKTIEIRQYNGPGGWNDPDYIILGKWRSPFNKAAPLTPVKLTPNEQYSYMSLWCLMASPLFFSGDMASLDEFTRGVLCNPEMIAVNQDRLGRCCRPIVMTDEQWVLAKPLADGATALGLLNLDGENDREIRVTWAQLGWSGPRRVRDIWRGRDLGSVEGGLRVSVGPHGCAVFKIQ